MNWHDTARRLAAYPQCPELRSHVVLRGEPVYRAECGNCGADCGPWIGPATHTPNPPIRHEECDSHCDPSPEWPDFDPQRDRFPVLDDSPSGIANVGVLSHALAQLCSEPEDPKPGDKWLDMEVYTTGRLWKVTITEHEKMPNLWSEHPVAIAESAHLAEALALAFLETGR